MQSIKRNLLFPLILTLIGACFGSPAMAQTPELLVDQDAGVLGRSELVSAPSMRVELLSSVQSISAGDSFTLALRMLPDEHWHFYWQNPGDTGLPTRVAWQDNQALEYSELEWPVPQRADYQGFINYGYYGETLLITEVQAPENLAVGEPLQIQAQADWLICEEVCIPGRAVLDIEIATGRGTQISPWATQIEAAQGQLPQDLGKLDGYYSISGGFQLYAQLPQELQSLRPVEFFPISQKLVNNLTIPSFSADEETASLVISTQNAESPAEYPASVEGLLIFENTAGERSAYNLVVDAHSSVFSGESSASMSFLLVLLFALFGGLILNLMPCVLPVLSLKVMHLVEERDASNRKIQGIAYTAGVVVSFLVIAGLMLALRAAGEGIGWGFQLQSPIFIGFLVYVVFVLGLSLSGFLELGASLTQLGNLGTRFTGPLSSSFMTGALATVVATPCTAPFMGTAMGIAVTMSTPLALLVFATLGLGLALPFLIVAFVPAFANALPRPGQWMVTLKELLAFPLYLTAIWLLWVFANQTGVDQLAMLLAGLVLIVFGIWILRTKPENRIALVAALVIWVAALAVLPTVNSAGSDNPIEKIAYSEQALSAAQRNNQAVFVNMTADWCITCKVNERVALRNAEVEDLFSEQGVVYLEGDWTNSDENITKVLERFERSGVPLYLAYLPGESEPQVLPQVLTPGIVLEAFEVGS